MSRTTDRQNLDHPARFMFIEGDMDRLEGALTELNERVSKVLWALLGILMSTTTAAVMLALNLATK